MTSATYEITACPACGSEHHDSVAGGEQVRAEVEQLWAFHLRRLRRGVPTRRLFDRIVFSQAPPLQLVRCHQCGLVFRNPRERARALVEEYATEETDGEILRSLFDAQLDACREQARRLARHAGRVNAGLEVGSYLGAFLAAAGERGWRFRGIDVNARSVRFARGLGLAAATGSLDDPLPERSHDAVAIWNCFEQLPEPRVASRAAHRLLIPGGLLVIRVPDAAFYSRLRPLLAGPLAPLARAFLAHNNLLGFPYRHGFSRGSLGRLLEEAGFEILEARGDVLVPTADRWTRRWAVQEERLTKRLLSLLAVAGPAPWLEVYARARPA
jgi:SAM-dependent methyltransferase